MQNTQSDARAATYSIDPIHTSIGFRVRHLMITNVHGTFQNVSGTVVYAPGRPQDTRIRVEIDAASVFTRNAQRDDHLRNDHFFDAERHRAITFRSTRVRVPNGDEGARLDVIGDMTIRGVTREVTLVVTEITGEQKDHNGVTRIGASATAKIRRSEFGITYNRLLETGGVAISDDIAITLDVSLMKGTS